METTSLVRCVLIAAATLFTQGISASTVTSSSYHQNYYTELRTGYDEAKGTVLSSGQKDNSWKLNINDPDGYYVTKPVVKPDGSNIWPDPVPGTTFIGPKTYQDPGSVNNYVYKSYFNLNGEANSYKDITIQIQAWADDVSDVYLNGHKIGSTVARSQSNPSGSVASMPTIEYDQADLQKGYFKFGQNELKFVVKNTAGKQTALDVFAVITAVPEASEWLMLLGSVGLAGCIWRKRLGLGQMAS